MCSAECSTKPTMTPSSTISERSSSPLSRITSFSSRAITLATRSGSYSKADRNITRMIPTKTTSRMTTIGARLTTKSLNDRSARLPMMMLGGSPISVAVPPMFDASTSAMRNGTGLTPSRSQTRSVTGAMSSTVVTLSSSADATAVIIVSSTMTANGLPLARLAAQMAT